MHSNIVRVIEEKLSKNTPNVITTHTSTFYHHKCRITFLPVTHFGGNVYVDPYTYKPAEMCFLTWNKLQTDTWHSFLRHNWDYLWFQGDPILFPNFFTQPPSIFLPVHNRFCPSKWWVDGSLHKDTSVTSLGCDKRRMRASDYSTFLLSSDNWAVRWMFKQQLHDNWCTVIHAWQLLSFKLG